MVEIVNTLIECVVTGITTALCLLFFGKMGWLPFMLIMTEDMLPPEGEE